MAAVYGPSMNDLQKVLRCNDQEMKKLARQMSETIILGSMEIWRNNVKRIERGNRGEANELIANEEARIEEARVELERQRNIENGENRNQNEEEGDVMNEIEADRDVEEIEDEEEENGQEGQEGQAERDGRYGREAEAETEVETAGADDDTETKTGMRFGSTEDAADDEDGGQDPDSE
jgi:hypothetical protein